jgi:hypothetical protein
MGYSEEQTRVYNSMMYAFNVFDEMKKNLSSDKCHIHNKKLKMEASWEREYDIDITIYKYCYVDFAEQIAKKFIDVHLFSSVTIEKQ